MVVLPTDPVTPTRCWGVRARAQRVSAWSAASTSSTARSGAPCRQFGEPPAVDHRRARAGAERRGDEGVTVGLRTAEGEEELALADPARVDRRALPDPVEVDRRQLGFDRRSGVGQAGAHQLLRPGSAVQGVASARIGDGASDLLRVRKRQTFGAHQLEGLVSLARDHQNPATGLGERHVDSAADRLATVEFDFVGGVSRGPESGLDGRRECGADLRCADCRWSRSAGRRVGRRSRPSAVACPDRDRRRSRRRRPACGARTRAPRREPLRAPRRCGRSRPAPETPAPPRPARAVRPAGHDAASPRAIASAGSSRASAHGHRGEQVLEVVAPAQGAQRKRNSPRGVRRVPRMPRVVEHHVARRDHAATSTPKVTTRLDPADSPVSSSANRRPCASSTFRQAAPARRQLAEQAALGEK